MTPLNREDLNKNLIEKLSMDNPIIKMVLMLYIGGQLTWEESLIAMVAWLSNYNTELARAQEEYLSKQAPSLVLQLSDEELQRILGIVGDKLVRPEIK